MHPGRSSLLDNLLGLVADSDFHIEFHGVLWSCIRVLRETGGAHDPTAVLDYTRRKNLFVGGVEYMGTLIEHPMASVASDQAVLSAANRIKTYATLRGLQVMLSGAAQMCTNSGPDGLEDILSYVDDSVQSLRKTLHTSRTGPESMPKIMDEVMLGMEKQMDGEWVPATPTGYFELDNIISGLADEDLVVIGARPSMGKSALMVNIAENLSDAGDDVLIFSLEMKKTALGQRALARKARVDLKYIMRAELSDSDWGRVSEGLHALSSSRVWIDDSPGLTIHDIRARARDFVAKNGKCKIMVDYLQYISSANGRTEIKDHVAGVSRGLKNLARELKVPVVALSQLSRVVETRTNKRPMMSDLRESGAIEQDADIIMFVYRDEYYNRDTKEPGVSEIITAKNRNGPIGTAKLGFSGNISAFYNLEHP
jgi:replicative DNA helicase